MRKKEIIQYTVSWPLQGHNIYSSPDSVLILSDVYWMWIYDQLSQSCNQGDEKLPFVDAVENGFKDPRNLVETIPVDEKFVDSLRKLDTQKADSFDLLVPSDGCIVPTARQVLDVFIRIVSESIKTGKMVIEVE